jgi:hypothetical protein
MEWCDGKVRAVIFIVKKTMMAARIRSSHQNKRSKWLTDTVIVCAAL